MRELAFTMGMGISYVTQKMSDHSLFPERVSGKEVTLGCCPDLEIVDEGFVELVKKEWREYMFMDRVMGCLPYRLLHI